MIDLSHNNASVDFARVRAAGIVGVIHKATQGVSFQDKTYPTRMPLALSAGLLWGAYHFGTSGDGAAQADYFLNYAKPASSTLVALDFEENGPAGTMLLADAKKFVKRVFEVTGRYVGLYSNSFIVRQLEGQPQPDPLLKNCFLWYASYRDQPPSGLPKSFPTWTLWQYTDGNNGPDPHEVDGVGPCDRDSFNGDLRRLNALWNSTA